MSKQKSKESYANLERELGELRQKVAYQYLKRGVIETFVMGRMFGGSRGFAYKPMSETLGLSEKGDKELEQLSSSVLIPMQMVLDLTKRVMLTGAILRSPAFNEGMRKGSLKSAKRIGTNLGRRFSQSFLRI